MGHAQKWESLVSVIQLPRITTPVIVEDNTHSVFNSKFLSSKFLSSKFLSSKILSSSAAFRGSLRWSNKDFMAAHKAVVASGRYNYEGCRIPIPTNIRYDRIKEALGGKISPKESKTLALLEFGMPIDCQSKFGVRKKQKNHHSAVMFKDAINEYLTLNNNIQAILGPFEQSPIPDLSYSPLMTVPKEETKRRVIVDFSFPSGLSINDGIPKSTYLELNAEFSLPSVHSMTARLNELGRGCLMYKRDLKGAFRQFSIDPGDYRFTGLVWNGKTFIDTRLAMGLRSSAYCCQSVTELVAKIAGKEAHVLVYLERLWRCGAS